jgi:hypothetical protein
MSNSTDLTDRPASDQAIGQSVKVRNYTLDKPEQKA